ALDPHSLSFSSLSLFSLSPFSLSFLSLLSLSLSPSLPLSSHSPPPSLSLFFSPLSPPSHSLFFSLSHSTSHLCFRWACPSRRFCIQSEWKRQAFQVLHLSSSFPFSPSLSFFLSPFFSLFTMTLL